MNRALALFAIGVPLAFAAGWLVRASPRVAGPAPDPVRGRQLLAVIGAGVLASLTAGGLVALLDGGILLELWGAQIVLFACALAAWWIADGARGLGLVPAVAPRALCGAFLSWVLLLPLILALGIFWRALCEVLGIELPPEQQVLARLVDLEGSACVQALLVAVVVGPFLEELVFRGFLQRVLVSWLGVYNGVVATALLFAVGFHEFSVFLPLFALALLLGALRQASASVWTSVLVHAASNASNLALVLVFPEWAESPS